MAVNSFYHSQYPGFIKIGDMRQRVQVQLRSDAPTGHFNETKEAWATVATRWASISTTTGFEREWGEQQNATISHVVHMRMFKGLDPRLHRLLYRGRVFNVKTVLNVDERNAAMDVACTEQVGEV